MSAALEVGGFLWRGGWAAERRLRAGPPLRVPSSLVALAQSLHRATGDWAMWLDRRELKPSLITSGNHISHGHSTEQ